MKTILSLGLFCILSSSMWSAEIPGYSEKVAPIIFKNCVNCHRDGEIGPFSLTNYSETKQHASTIKDRVLSGFMPPWKPLKDYGHFVNERRLSDAEKQTIRDWVDGGMPEGDKSQLPTLPKFPQGSQLGTPDLVLRLPVKWNITGNNQDVYRNFVIPTGLLEDKVISAIEVRPDNRKVVHHVLLWNDTTGQGRLLDAQDTETGYEDFGGPGFDNPTATYPGYAPGANVSFFPAGIGLKMHKNSDLIVQMHYAPSASDEEDQTSINVFFKKESKTRLITEQAILPDYIPGGYNAFVMPANKVSTFKGTLSVNSDVSLLSVFPHMHKLGVNAKLYAVTSTKDTIRLINIPSWDFTWQGEYNYEKLTKIPRGSKIYYEATYDNTDANPFNPNSPPKTMSWGFKTSEEMYLCYLFTLPYQKDDENISQQTTDVAFEGAAELSSIDMKGINPNPSKGTSVLEFRLFRENVLSIDVMDISGRIVSKIETEKLFSEGSHSVALITPQLSSGTYICRVHINGKSIAIPYSLIR